MPENGTRSTYSQAPIKIDLLDAKKNRIASGSAFFYDFEGENFLVTNWHNVSGRAFDTRRILHKPSQEPIFMVAYLSRWFGDKGHYTANYGRLLSLYDKNGNPTWYVHKTHKSNYDVVVFPFPRDETIPEFMHYPVNKISKFRKPILPGNTVFIIGYPSGISIAHGLPIWKSGYLASEPFYNIKNQGKEYPAVFLDSLTRAGLSGAPVFSQYKGTWSLNDPYEKLDPESSEFWERSDILLNETRYEFLGIYSGRLESNAQDAALGLCWKESLIREICKEGIKDDNPHFLPKEPKKA